MLTALHLLKAIPSQTGLPGFLLNESFRDNFKHCFLGGGNRRSTFSSLKSDKHLQSIESLDDYAMTKRWDSILNHMAGVKTQLEARDAIGDTSRKVLAHANLVVPNEEALNGESSEITAMGFQFLLMDISSQIWFFIRKYLETTPRELFLERLGFLFELNFFTLGKVSFNLAFCGFKTLTWVSFASFCYHRATQRKECQRQCWNSSRN